MTKIVDQIEKLTDEKVRFALLTVRDEIDFADHKLRVGTIKRQLVRELNDETNYPRRLARV